MMEFKTIEEILKNKIVIPEIQREYVWGSNQINPEIVRNFVMNINEKARVNESIQLGFLYSYAHGGELHLIDGQQRMTTLVLLAFFCFCHEEKPSEKVIKSLMRFSYRVRVETEQFLFSLFNHKDDFIKDFNLFQSDRLKDTNWYRSKYDTDTTINSMVKCLDTIYHLHHSLDSRFKISTTWLLNRVSFWTFEVTQTSQGEELYISMNSRGEALTDSELFKPKLFEREKEFKCSSAESWGKAWDNWEELLFSKRGEHPIESVSDAMNTFLRIIIELESGKPHGKIEPTEDANLVTLTSIENYFRCLEIICREDSYQKELHGLYESKYSLLILKILICLVHAGEEDAEIKRVYPIIKNWERRGLLKNESLLKVLFGFLHQKGERKGWLDYILVHISEHTEPNKRQLDGVLDNHEWLKIKRYQAAKDNELEKVYHEAEQDTILHGYLRSVWDKAFDSSYEWDEKSKQIFIKRFKLFKDLFNDSHTTINLSHAPQEGRIDNSLITRALLAIEPYGVWVSGQNYAYGWKNGNRNYWRILASKRDVSGIISKLIDILFAKNISSEEQMYSVLSDFIAEPDNKYKYDKGSGLFYILNYPNSLKAQFEGHNVLSFEGGWDNFNIWILEKDNAHSYYYNLFVSLLYSLCKNKEGVSKIEAARIEMKNHLYIKCSSKQGWDVVYEDWNGDLETLKLYLTKMAALHGTSCIDNDNTNKQRCFHIPRGENDQISLGLHIIEHLCSFH